MSRLLPVILCLFLCGCLDAKVDPKLDVKSQIQSEVKANIDSLVKAELNPYVESLVKTQVDSLVKAEIKAEVETNINPKLADFQTQIHSTTQNEGMFSGGAIYVLVFGCFVFLVIAGTVIYLVRLVLRWKRLWNLVSHSIEVQSGKSGNVKDLKEHFGSMLEISGLKGFVDQNLKNRGLNKPSRD